MTHLDALIEASKLLNSTLDLEQLLEIILDIAGRQTHAATGTIYIVDHTNQTLWSKVSDYNQKKDLRLPFGSGIAGWVALTGETVNAADVYQHPRFNAEFDRKSGFHTHTMLCMPMRDEQQRIIGVFQLINKEQGQFTVADQAFLQDLSVHAALAIRQAEWHRDAMAKKALDTELLIARDIQKHLLPMRLPEIVDYAAAAVNVPCESVSGDYYDLYQQDERLCLAIGDVAGKGVAAALVMAGVRAALRTSLMIKTRLAPAELLQLVNQYVYDSAPHNRFMTFFYAELDLHNHCLHYVNAGHNPPILISRDRSCSYLNKCGVPLGVNRQTIYQAQELVLAPGDLLILYTDGITEAMNPEQQEFGEEELHRLALSCTEKTGAEIAEAVMQSVIRFRGSAEQSDDITLLVLKRLATRDESEIRKF
jgi:phosphoserine phosphatase RsbU/P